MSTSTTFEASKVMLTNELKLGLGTLTLDESGRSFHTKSSSKKYRLDRISGISHQSRGRMKNKVQIEISSEDDLEITFGGLKGNKNAIAFKECLLGLI